MKKNMGEFDEGLKKLFNSFKKRFGLKCGESLDYVDNILKDRSYAVLYFTSDITYTKELIEEINSSGVGSAYGLYRNTYDSVDEIKEAVPNIIGDGGDKFIVVEIDDKSKFRLEEIPHTTFVKLCRSYGEIVVDIVKSREYIEEEDIHRMRDCDSREFNLLYRSLYMKRREIKPKLFRSNVRMDTVQMSSICSGHSEEVVFVCYRDQKIVGFIVFENVIDKVNDGLEHSYDIYVKDLFVLEEYRRIGIATRLFREVCRYADKCRHKSVRLRNWAFDKDVEGFINSLNKKVLHTTYEIEL